MKIQPKRPQEVRERMGRSEAGDPYIFGLPSQADSLEKENKTKDKLAQRGRKAIEAELRKRSVEKE